MVERFLLHKMRQHCNKYIRIRKSSAGCGATKLKGFYFPLSQMAGKEGLHVSKHAVEGIRRIGALIESDENGMPRTELDDDLDWLETLAERGARKQLRERPADVTEVTADVTESTEPAGPTKKRPFGGQGGLSANKRPRTGKHGQEAPPKKGKELTQAGKSQPKKGLKRRSETVLQREEKRCKKESAAPSSTPAKRPKLVSRKERDVLARRMAAELLQEETKQAETQTTNDETQESQLKRAKSAGAEGAQEGAQGAEPAQKKPGAQEPAQKKPRRWPKGGKNGWVGESYPRRTWEVGPFVLNKNTLELPLIPDGGEPAPGEVKLVPTIHWSFHTSGQCGAAKKSDWGSFPLYHYEKVGKGVGRCRATAVAILDNAEEIDGEQCCMPALDAHCEPNWTQVLIRTHRLLNGEGGVGSKAWLRRTFGPLPDPWLETKEWAEVALDQIRGTNNQRLSGAGFGGQYALAENQDQIPLVLLLCSDIFLQIGNTYFRTELCSLVKMAKKLGIHAFTAERFLRDHSDKIAWLLGAAVQLMVDTDAVGGEWNIMKADVGRMVRAKWVTFAWLRKGHVAIEKKGRGSGRNNKMKTYVHKDLLETEEWKDVQRRFGLSTLGKGKPLERHEMGGKKMTVNAQAFHSGADRGDEHRYKYQSAKKPAQGPGGVPHNQKGRKRDAGQRKSGGQSRQEERIMGEPPEQTREEPLETHRGGVQEEKAKWGARKVSSPSVKKPQFEVPARKGEAPSVGKQQFEVPIGAEFVDLTSETRRESKESAKKTVIQIDDSKRESPLDREDTREDTGEVVRSAMAERTRSKDAPWKRRYLEGRKLAKDERDGAREKKVPEESASMPLRTSRGGDKTEVRGRPEGDTQGANLSQGGGQGPNLLGERGRTVLEKSRVVQSKKPRAVQSEKPRALQSEKPRAVQSEKARSAQSDNQNEKASKNGGALKRSQKRGKSRKGKRGRGQDAAWRQDACDGLYGIFDSPGRRGRGREVYVHLMKRMNLEHMILPGRREVKMQPRSGRRAARRAARRSGKEQQGKQQSKQQGKHPQGKHQPASQGPTRSGSQMTASGTEMTSEPQRGA